MIKCPISDTSPLRPHSCRSATPYQKGDINPCLRGLRPLRHGLTVMTALRVWAPLSPPDLARAVGVHVRGYALAVAEDGQDATAPPLISWVGTWTSRIIVRLSPALSAPGVTALPL